MGDNHDLISAVSGFATFRYREPDVFSRTRYAGLVRGGGRDGRGRLRWRDGAVYSGEFTNGTRQGYARMVYANRDEYEGNFVGNKRNDARGLYKWSDSGAIYVGAFVDGVMVDDEAELFYSGDDDEVSLNCST